MCYAKPGPRCIADTTRELETTRNAYATAIKNDDAKAQAQLRKKLALLEREVEEATALSPSTITSLREESMGLTETDEIAAVRLFAQADSIERVRKQLIGLTKGDVQTLDIVKDAQERAEKPAAEKRQWVGASFTDDDLVGSAIDAANGEGRSFSVDDVDYTLDEENDQIVISAVWADTDADGPHLAMNFADVNSLDPDHRPTDEEASAIAADLNREYDEQVGRPAWQADESEDRSAWRSAVEEGVVVNVADAITTTGSRTNEELSDILSRKGSRFGEHLRSRIVFKETYTPYKGFDASYVQETWDSLYGED